MGTKPGKRHEPYALLLKSSADPMWMYAIVKGQPGRFIAVNLAATQLLGYSDKEFQRMTLFDVAAPPMLGQLKRHWPRFLTEGTISYETALLTKSGVAVGADVNSTVMTLNGQTLVLSTIRDTRERIRYQSSLQENYLRFDALLNALPDAIVVHRDGAIRYANKSALRMWALPDHTELSGRTMWEFIHPDERAAAQASYDTLHRLDIPGESLPPVERTILRNDGTTSFGEVRNVLIKDHDGKPSIMNIIKDISLRKRLSEELQFMAFHDPLTGLPNRRRFMERLTALLKDGNDTPSHHHALVVLDFDRFKNINDVYGHVFGDVFLQKAADRLRPWGNHDVLVARLGGDEFAILLSHQSREIVEKRVAALSADLNAPLTIEKRILHITASIGVALYPEAGRSVDALLKHADMAMYAAKQHRGDAHIAYYHPKVQKALTRRIRIEERLRHAVAHDEFRLEYQPKVALPNGTLCSIEALLRWHPQQGAPLPPNEFIPIAEEAGLITVIGEWVLREACRQVRQWHVQGYHPPSVSVNVSPLQFKRQCLDKVIEQALKDTGLPPELLGIELTEGLLAENPQEVAKVLQRIHRLGVNIAIDDFGTGYSSLRYLHLFEANVLKIDRSFVETMLEDANDMAIVSAVIRLGHTLGMQVVAEGVETAAQVKRLITEGCDVAQGYYYSKPVRPEVLVSRWLSHGTLVTQ